MTDIIAQFKKSEHDTGSVQVQVIMLTTRINQLNEHFKTHPKDFGSKRGLLLLVGQRRKFLDYIKHKDAAQYKMMIEKLGLRK